jgi:hypothetical protein
MIDSNVKDWIDNSSYETLLKKWRYAPVGSPYFQGETGDYYAKIMAEKRDAVGDEAAVRASKNIDGGQKC